LVLELNSEPLALQLIAILAHIIGNCFGYGMTR